MLALWQTIFLPFFSRAWPSFSISLVLAWDSCSNFSSIWCWRK